MLRRKNAKKLYHVSLEVGNKYRLTKKHTSLVSVAMSPLMKNVYRSVLASLLCRYGLLNQARCM